MAELEKVIKGLECLSNPYVQDMDERDCENCKYDSADHPGLCNVGVWIAALMAAGRD